MDVISLIIVLIGVLFGSGIFIRYYSQARVLVELKGIKGAFPDKSRLAGLGSYYLLSIDNRGRHTAEDISVTVKSSAPIMKLDLETIEEPHRIVTKTEKDGHLLRVNISMLRKGGYTKIGFQTYESSRFETHSIIARGIIESPPRSDASRYVKGICLALIFTSLLTAIPTLVKGWITEGDIWLLVPAVYIPLFLSVIGTLSLLIFASVQKFRRSNEK